MNLPGLQNGLPFTATFLNQRSCKLCEYVWCRGKNRRQNIELKIANSTTPSQFHENPKKNSIIWKNVYKYMMILTCDNKLKTQFFFLKSNTVLKSSYLTVSRDIYLLLSNLK